MILTIIVFILMLSLLVIVHELGHFLVAKACGVKVEEFAIGFPPRIYSVKKGETEYSINAIPLGGYVKMLGELEHSKDKRAFENQKPRARFLISIAGVLMNLVLAWIILTVGFSVGMPPIVSSPESIHGDKISSEIVLADITKGSPADKAGILPGDIAISAVSNNKTTTFTSLEQFDVYNTNHKNKNVAYTLKRKNETLVKKVKLSNDSDSQLGVAIIEKDLVRVAWYRAPIVALRETYEILKLTFVFLGSIFVTLFKAHKVAEGVGGPVAIYTYTGLAVKAGIMIFLQFVALISINLALVNILPFPALDGGRLIFISLERIFGKKVVKESVENIIHNIGFGILIVLMLAISYHDVVNLIHK